MKVLGDAPAIAMGNLFATAAMFSGDPRLVAKTTGLFESLLDLSATSPTKAPPPGEGLYAEIPPVSFDWSESATKDGGDAGRGGGHGPSRGADDGAGLATALALFKGIGHGDLDL